MAMSKILADRYSYTTMELMTSAEMITDDVRAATCAAAKRVGDGDGGKAAPGKKRRRRRSLASRNLDEMELQMLRQKINGRERQRMHDLNSALDGLREVYRSYNKLFIAMNNKKRSWPRKVVRRGICNENICLSVRLSVSLASHAVTPPRIVRFRCNLVHGRVMSSQKMRNC